MIQLHTFLALFLALLMWHAIADYPLQGDFMARAKNRNTPVPGIPWYIIMLMHTLIHAAGVWVLTGIIWLAFAEIVLHFLIDDMKCRKRISFETDQFLHLLCKAMYVVIVIKFHGNIMAFFSLS